MAVAKEQIRQIISENNISSVADVYTLLKDKMEEKIALKDKPTLTIEEASSLYNIGEHKLRELTDFDTCNFVLYVGRKRLIKRKQFDDYIARAFSI